MEAMTIKKRNVKMRRLRKALTGYAFIGVNVLGVCVFCFLPLIFSLVLSVSKWDQSKGLAGIRFSGFDNYIKMWSDEWFRASLINNIIFTVFYVLLVVVLSFFVALLLNEKILGKKTVKMGLYMPYIVNTVAIAAVFLALFSRQGPVSMLLKALGMEDPPLFLNSSQYALATVTGICVWQALGYTAMLFLAGLVNVPKDLLEAADIDGAGWWKKTINVTIPVLKPTTFFVLVTSIINSFKVFGLINIMTSGGPGSSTTMIVYNIYRTAFRFNKIEFASAQGIVLTIFMFIVTLIQYRAQKSSEC